MRRTTANLKLRTQMNRLSLNNLIRHSTKPVSVADVFASFDAYFFDDI